MNTTILGAGSFGTAMAVHLTSLGHNVKMWTIDAEQAEIMNREHRNNFCFFDTALPDKIAATRREAEIKKLTGGRPLTSPTGI